MNSGSWMTAVRRAEGPGRSEVGPIELFFDLVYVFSIVQLSHFLLHDLSWSGAARFVVLFGAIWWAWNYTAWAMNWLNPASGVVRLLNVVLMLAGLGMALAVPEAFDDRPLLFAGCIALAQIVRPVFMIAAYRGHVLARNYAHLLAWSSVASVLWVAGAFVPGEARIWVWLAALVVDVSAPRLEFWVPGRGSAPMADWPTDAEHLGERNRLVFIIALGESVLILGSTLSGMADLSGSVVVVSLLGFGGLVVLWWGYFAVASEEMHSGGQPRVRTALLRSAFAYAHALMVAGALIVAVSIELRLSHDHLDEATVLTTVGGPLLYLVGNVLYLRSRGSSIVASRFVAGGALVVVGAIVLVAVEQVPTVVLGLLVVGIMTVLVIYSQYRTSQLRV